MATLQLFTNARITTAAPSCALSKKGHRFLTSVATSRDDSATHHASLLRKFIKSSSKHVALNTFSHLLSPSTSHPSHLSSLVLPMYLMITEAPWFSWNAKLAADVIAAVYKQERFSEAERLMEETVERIGVQKKRDLCDLYCYLIESTAKHQLKEEFHSFLTLLRELVTASTSSSVHVRKRAYESMIGGLCEIGMPSEAEDLMGEMRAMGLKPSGFQFRSLVYAYGKLGLFDDMKRNVVEMGELDTVCCNMVLSALGSHNELAEMVYWLQRMKVSEVPFSMRSYNSVLNSCPTIMSMLKDPKSVPLSLEELTSKLGPDESNLVMELVAPPTSSTSSSVVDSLMEWKSSELKLDLHGMHLSCSYLIFLQWIEGLRLRYSGGGEHEVPAEITLVCGSGKHSMNRGISPVKGLLKEMIMRMKCPLKIDRKNIGCFVAKGKVFRDWLLC